MLRPAGICQPLLRMKCMPLSLSWRARIWAKVNGDLGSPGTALEMGSSSSADPCPGS